MLSVKSACAHAVEILFVKIAKAWTMVRVAGTADGMRESEILCRWHSFVRANVPVAQRANSAD